MKHALAVLALFALAALVVPTGARAQPRPSVAAAAITIAPHIDGPRSAPVGFHTGMHAPDVAPLVFGVVADGAQMRDLDARGHGARNRRRTSREYERGTHRVGSARLAQA